ncbi:MAG: ABC transporter permease [Gammaproteobacteria bacterium]
MRRTWIVFLKETLDNLRDRRTLLTSLLLGPLLGPLLFVLIMNTMLKERISDLEKPLQLPVIGSEYAPNFIQFMRENNTAILPGPENAEQAIRDREHSVVMIIRDEYTENFVAGLPARVQLVFDASDRDADKDVSRARRLVNAYSRQIGALRLMARGVDPRAMHAITLDDVDISTPEARGVLLLGIVPYFVILTIMMGGFYLAIDTTAGERERGSLEPLLCTAATRAELATGKLMATTLFAILSLVIVLISFHYGGNLIELERLGMTANLSVSVMTNIFIVALPFTLLGSAMLTVIASFTRSFKEAQTWLSIVLLVPAFPAFIPLLYPVKMEMWMMLVPSYNISALIMEYMKDKNIPDMFVTVTIVTNLVLGILLSWLAIHLYKREKVLG